MLFVLSAGRSGSRTISNVLSQSDDMVCTHEPRPRLIEECVRYRYGDFDAGALEKLLRTSRPTTIFGRRYGEAANRLSLATPVLASAFPDAQFLWLVRDGREFVASGMQRGWFSDARDTPWEPWERFRLRGDRLGEVETDEWEAWTPFRRVCWLWRRTNEIIRDDLAELGRDRFRLVRLEELAAEMDQIAEFLGIARARWSVDRLNARSNEPRLGDTEVNRVAVRTGPVDWTDEEAEVFALECGGLMDEVYPQWRTPGSSAGAPTRATDAAVPEGDFDPVATELAELRVLRAEMKLFVEHAKRTDRQSRAVLEERDAAASENATLAAALASSEREAARQAATNESLQSEAGQLERRLGETEEFLDQVLGSESYRVGNLLMQTATLPQRSVRQIRRTVRRRGARLVRTAVAALAAHPATARLARRLPDRLTRPARRFAGSASSPNSSPGSSTAPVPGPRFGLRAVLDESVSDVRWTAPIDAISIDDDVTSPTHVDLLIADAEPSPALEELAATWTDAVTLRTAARPAPLPAGLSPMGIGDDHDGSILAVATSADAPSTIASPLPGREVVIRALGDLPDPISAPVEFARAMHGYLAILDDGRLHHDQRVRAELLLAASACGLPVVLSDSERLRGLVAPEVLSAWIDVDVRLLTRSLDRERISWEQRRLVHRHHSARAVFHDVLVAGGRPGLPTPSMSVLVASNRPALVDHWSPLVAAQDHPDFEVVWAQHGSSFSDRHEALAREHLGDRLTIVQVPEHHGLGDALNAATGAASGRIIVKWDDDDYYHTGHLTDLAVAREYSGATLVGKTAEFVYLEHLDVTIRRFASSAEAFSTTIGGPTLSIARGDLEDLGGWRRTRRRVDALLIEDVRASGGTTYRTSGFGFVMMRAADSGHTHTWGAGDDYFLRNAIDARKGLDLEFAGLAPSEGRVNTPAEVIRHNEWHFLDTTHDASAASVSVIVPARDCQPALDRLLASLAAQDHPADALEVIVVDDASSPPLVVPDGVERVALTSTDRFGAGRARNAGAARATGELLVFLDADVLVGSDVIRRLSAWYRRHRATVVTGILGFFDLEAIGEDAVSAAIVDRRLPELLAGRTDNDQHWRDAHFRRTHDLTVDEPDLYRPTIGAIMAVPTVLHRSIDGLRELGIRGIEDTEYGYRLHTAGALFVLDRDLALWHQGRRFFDSARADEAKERRKALNLELLPVPSVRSDVSVSRRVPVATVTMDDGVSLDGWDARQRRDVCLLDGLDPVDLAASPYALHFVSSCRIDADSFDQLLDHARVRGLGVVHLLGSEGTEIGTLTSRRALGRATLDGHHGPDAIAQAAAAFGEWWLPAHEVGLHG